MAPRPLTPSARSGSSHSKCVISRRSKRIGFLGRPRRPLVAAEVVGEHLLHDGRGDGAAPAARVLDDARDRDLGRVEGREGDEPRVVAHHLGAAVGARAVLAHLDHLRGAGLSRHHDAGHARLLARAALAHHHLAHAIAHLRERALLEMRLAEHLRLDLEHGPVRADDPLHVEGPAAGAAAGDGRRQIRHLERRGGHVALADRDRERLALEPGLAEAPPLPLRVRDRPGLLVREGDAGGTPKPQAMRVLGDPIDAQPAPNLVEEHVARLDDGLVQVDGAVPALLPAVEEMVPEGHAARAGDAREGGHHAFLQRARGDRDLEGRAGGEHALHGAVVERVLPVLDQRAPLRAPDAAREHVGVEGRVRDHREHLAAPWVERDDCPVGLAEGAVGGFLKVTVEGECERPARAVRLFLQHPDATPERIHLHLLVTGVAAQVLVEGLLEARLADQVAAHVVAVVLRELALAHLADVAEEMRGERPERIVAFRRDPQRDAGQVELMRLERDHPLPVDVAPEHDALVVLALAPGGAYSLVEPRLLLAEVPGKGPQDLAPALAPAGCGSSPSSSASAHRVRPGGTTGGARPARRRRTRRRWRPPCGAGTPGAPRARRRERDAWPSHVRPRSRFSHANAAKTAGATRAARAAPASPARIAWCPRGPGAAASAAAAAAATPRTRPPKKAIAITGRPRSNQRWRATKRTPR